MADQLGVTQSSYARFENQVRKIDFELVERIAVIFGMSLTDLIGYHQKNEYQIPGEAPALAEERERYHIKEVELYEEKINYLEQLVKMLEVQLADKDQIIELLKKNQRD